MDRRLPPPSGADRRDRRAEQSGGGLSGRVHAGRYGTRQAPAARAPRHAPARSGPRRRILAVVAVVAVVGVAMAWAVGYRSDRGGVERVEAPGDYFPLQWRDALGGDQPMTEADWAALGDPSRSDLGSAEARAAAQLATAIVAAQLTGQGRERWPEYFSAVGPAVEGCDPRLLGAAATALPVYGADGSTDWAKVLVAWSGTCGAVSGTAAVPRIEYVYLQREAGSGPGGWVPLGEAQIPRSPEPERDLGGVPSWALSPLGPCAKAPGLLARPEVGAAFEVMCQAAARDGVRLRATSAYRDPSDQAERYADAREAYGSDEEARRWVASSDGSRCTSRHCAGAAVDVAARDAALAWLGAVVGCRVGATAVPAQSCPPDAAPVSRRETYGFSAPLAGQPWHLEYALPLVSVSGYCNLTDGAAVPELVAEIWRCEIRSAGLTGAEATVVARSAVMVARCVSGWAPGWVAAGGRWVAATNPDTGRRETAAGVFGLDEAVATRYIEGGYGRVADPVSNITAAAQLYLAELRAGRDGWAYWGTCAQGTPARGGTEPDWVRIY